jgi:hypothetical protein
MSLLHQKKEALAFGQYGELGPGFEQLLDQLAEDEPYAASACQCVNGQYDTLQPQ